MVGEPCKLGIAWAPSHKADGVRFTQFLHEASPTATIGPLRDDDPSSQARVLVMLSFTPTGADSAPLDACLYTTGLTACRCGVRLVMLWSNIRDSV